jgi:hypothetical protein
MKLSNPEFLAGACLVAMLAAPAGVLARNGARDNGGDKNKDKKTTAVPEPSTLGDDSGRSRNRFGPSGRRHAPEERYKRRIVDCVVHQTFRVALRRRRTLFIADHKEVSHRCKFAVSTSFPALGPVFYTSIANPLVKGGEPACLLLRQRNT